MITQKIVEEMSELNPQELSTFCMQNEENIELCSREVTWRRLLANVFPDIFKIAEKMEFPDLERELRSSRRQFIPMRELYTQLLYVSVNRKHLKLINRILDNKDVSKHAKKYLDITRIYYQTLSFLLSYVSSKWKEYLVRKDDLMVKFLTFNLAEMKRLTYKYYTNVISRRYLTDPRVDTSENSHLAIRTFAARGDTEIVRLLLRDRRVNPAARNSDAIRAASREGHSNVVELLLADKRADPSSEDNEAIRTASSEGHSEVVELLLNDSRVDPSVFDNFAIRIASRKGYDRVVKLLLAHPEVMPSVDNDYAIWIASLKGHVEVVRLLLGDPRVDPAVEKNAALQAASDSGHTEVVKLLLSDPRVEASGRI